MIRNFLIGALIVSFLSFGSLARSCDNAQVRRLRVLSISNNCGENVHAANVLSFNLLGANRLVSNRVVFVPHNNVVQKFALAPGFVVQRLNANKVHVQRVQKVQKVVVRRSLLNDVGNALRNTVRNLGQRRQVVQKVIVRENIRNNHHH